MRQILTFKLFDGTEMNFICNSKSKEDAIGLAINYSRKLFNNKKFIIKAKTEIKNYEVWRNAKERTQINGSHNFNVALVAGDKPIIDSVNADGIKSAYNIIKSTLCLDYDPIVFFYDLSQCSKLKAVQGKAQFILANRGRTDKLIDDFCGALRKLPIAGNIVGEMIADLVIWKSLINDVRIGVYDRIPVNSIIKIVCVIIYFVTPVNTAFEWVPIIGQVDDIILIKMLHSAIRQDVQNYVRWQQEQGRYTNQNISNNNLNYDQIKRPVKNNNNTQQDKPAQGQPRISLSKN